MMHGFYFYNRQGVLMGLLMASILPVHASFAYRMLSKPVVAALAVGAAGLCVTGLEKEQRGIALQESASRILYYSKDMRQVVPRGELLCLCKKEDIPLWGLDRLERAIAKVWGASPQPDTSYVTRMNGRTYVVLTERDRKALEGQGEHGLTNEEVLAFLERDAMGKDLFNSFEGQAAMAALVPAASVAGRAARLSGGRAAGAIAALGTVAAFFGGSHCREKSLDTKFATTSNNFPLQQGCDVRPAGAMRRGELLAGYLDKTVSRRERENGLMGSATPERVDHLRKLVRASAQPSLAPLKK